MTYFDDEKSQASGEPVELYEFVGSNATYRLTSGDEDFTFMSNVYTRTPIERTAIQGNSGDDRAALEISLPFDEQIVQDFAFDVAPRDLTMTLTRVHPFSSNSRIVWRGAVTSITVEGRLAKIRVPSPLAEALATDIPKLKFQTLCQHILYDERCRVLRGDFDVATTVAAISADGLTITLTSDGGNPDDWLTGGEILRDSDGERRLILDHVGDDITLNWPFRNLAVTDAITLVAGCDHLITTCDTKFANAVNFGGHPQIPPLNIFLIYQGSAGE